MSNLNVEDQEDSESHNPNLASSKDAVDTSHVEEKQTTKSDKPEEPRNQIRQTLYSKMYILCRELCFLLLLVFTYAAFQNNTPKISKSPNAFPFFPSGSIVKDWYRGELSKAIELASESDLAFVMYYAPWDAESQAVRQEFDIAAQHMHKYIHFAAINCWQPGSECRQQYSKVYSWPVLMAYPAHGRGIQYRGPRKAEHMLKFLQSVANPLTRINHIGDIIQHEPLHDAVVVGYVDAKLGSSKYGVFYTAALRFLERDPFREVQFLVITQDFSSPTDVPLLELHLWNETLIYPSGNEWRPEPIVSWITENLHQVSVWASPPGGKSQSLSNYLQPGPALILFTPRNPLYSNLDYYTVLHEVALDYYNCHDNIKINMYKTHTWFLRKECNLAHKQLESKCLASKKIKKEKFPTIVTYDVHKLWLNNTCNFKNTGPKLSVCTEKNLKKDACANIVESSPVILNKESYINKQSKNNNDYSPIFTENNDPRSPENLLKLAETEKCHFFRIAHELQPALFAPPIFNAQESKLTGLACKTNMSLSILALDSIQHHHFAEGLGIDILNKDDRSAVVIINPAFETHHVMQESFSEPNLQRFIHDFTSGVLDRTLSSTEILRRHTHYYKHHDSCQHNRTNDVCIHELSTSNFLPTIMQPDTAIIVLYHSVKCAFCSGVSHALLTTARKLNAVKNLHFARIDGDNHALPWEFAMHHYPSILFFPTRRKSESRVFPQNVPITVPNIISFILANVESNMKLKIMWTICSQTTYDEDLQKCITSLRIESMTLVGKLLRVYRFSTDVHYRTALLKQLQILRSLHFLLEHSLDINAVQKQISLLRPLDVTPKKLKREGVL